jgi:alcohol dehydrogenase class IV
MLNAILMPYVLKANRAEIEDRIVRLAAYLDLEESGFNGFMNWILQLREQLGIPANLSALGIDATEADTVARMATEDPSAGGNPICFSQEQYKQIFIDAVDGKI